MSPLRHSYSRMNIFEEDSGTTVVISIKSSSHTKTELDCEAPCSRILYVFIRVDHFSALALQ